MSKVIGIDLGTTYSAVATLNNGKPEIIPCANNKRGLPSVVCFHNDSIIVGEAALDLEYTHHETVIRKIKRKMGTDYKFQYKDRHYSPEEISAFIIKKLKDIAEESLGEKVKDAIITVPAYFNDNQRQATKMAGQIAGLNVLRIINEPTAASLAYGVKETDDLNIIIYDLGGGTFDVSLLNVADGVFEVLSTAGDNNLGGEDFNKRLADFVISKFKDETQIDLSEEPLAVVKIYEAVEAAKIALSEQKTTRIQIPFVTADESGPKSIDFEIKRDEFERMIADYIERSIELCKQTLSDGNMKSTDIHKVILVGGSSRIPMVRQRVSEFFNCEAEYHINPEEVVAMGAAIQGGIVEGDVSGIVLVDVTPMSMGIEVENGYFVPIIERNTPIPTSAKRVFTTVADGQRSVDVLVMQGESMYSKNNVSLGKFRLEGIRNAPKGEPRIEVNFELDVNGILHVSASDADTQNAQGITIVNSYRLSEEEMERIGANNVSAFEDEIKKRHCLTTVLKMKTKAESIASKIENSIPPAYRDSLIKHELSELKAEIDAALKEINPTKIQRVVDRLEFIQSEISAGSLKMGEMIA